MPTQTKPLPEAGDGEAAPGARAWSRVLADPAFHDLPYKIETNARGQLVLTAKKYYHSDLQGGIMLLLASERGPAKKGKPLPECAVQTAEGVKLPDVVWISAERAAQVREDAEALSVMPEICVEVLSRSNTQAEMEEKRHLFFEGGASLDASRLAPDFPHKVEQ